MRVAVAFGVASPIHLHCLLFDQGTNPEGETGSSSRSCAGSAEGTTEIEEMGMQVKEEPKAGLSDAASTALWRDHRCATSVRGRL